MSVSPRRFFARAPEVLRVGLTPRMPAAPAAKLVQADDGDLVEHAEPRALRAAPVENMT